jgi:hypothetical protein
MVQSHDEMIMEIADEIGLNRMGEDDDDDDDDEDEEDEEDDTDEEDDSDAGGDVATPPAV